MVGSGADYRRLLGAALGMGRTDDLARLAVRDERCCVRLVRWLGLDENLEEAEQRARRHLYEAAGVEAIRRQDETDALEGALADVDADPVRPRREPHAVSANIAACSSPTCRATI